MRVQAHPARALDHRVLAGIDPALSRDLGRYQHRWFEGLRTQVLAPAAS